MTFDEFRVMHSLPDTDFVRTTWSECEKARTELEAYPAKGRFRKQIKILLSQHIGRLVRLARDLHPEGV
jgi:hypothetical protein